MTIVLDAGALLAVERGDREVTDGEEIFPSDPEDLRDLALVAGRHVELISV